MIYNPEIIAYHIRNIPCFVSPIFDEATITDNPRTFLVSLGNITPSSQSRAVE